MRPAVLDYVAPRELPAALAALAEHGDDASLLAGGQSLLPLLNLRLARPELLIDINRVSGLDTIEVRDGELRIGALVRARTLEHDPQVAASLPVLRLAASHIAHPQIRNRTTIGGSLAHADPSSELPGILAALDGRVELSSTEGRRTVAWQEFFLGPFLTAKRPDELLSAAVFPQLAGWRITFSEFARRHGEYPAAGVVTGLLIDGGTIIDARLAAIAVAGTPVRLAHAESVLRGTSAASEECHHDAANAAAGEVDPPGDLHGGPRFRRALLATLLRRNLRDLTSGVDTDA